MTGRAWKAAAFDVMTDEGQEQVAGWVNGLFALDFRVFDVAHRRAILSKCRPGWAMTHLPTGRLTAGIVAPLAKAMEIAQEIAILGDWNFSDREKARKFASAINGLRAVYPGELLLKSAAFGPLFFSADATGAAS